MNVTYYRVMMCRASTLTMSLHLQSSRDAIDLDAIVVALRRVDESHSSNENLILVEEKS